MWRMRIACWVIKTTNTPTDYVIIFAFPPKQYLNERAPLLLKGTFPALLLTVTM